MAVTNDVNNANDVRVSGIGTSTWTTDFTNANANRIKDVGTSAATRQLTTNAVGGTTNGGITMQIDANNVLDLRGVCNLIMGKVWRMVTSAGGDSQTQASGTYIDISDGTTVQNHGSGNIAEVVAAYKADSTSKIMCNSGGFLWGSVQPANAIDGVTITFASGVGGDFHIGYNPLGYVRNVNWHVLGTSPANIQLGSQAIWLNNRAVPLSGFSINSTKGNNLINFFSWNQASVPWKSGGNDYWMIYSDLKYNVAAGSRPDAIQRSFRRAGWATPGSTSYWFNQGQMACAYLWIDPYTDMSASGVPGGTKTYIRKINYITTGTASTDGNAMDIVAFRYQPRITDSLGLSLQNAHIKVTCNNASVISSNTYGLHRSPVAAIGYTGSDGRFLITEPTTPDYNTNTTYYTDSGVFKTHAPSGKFHKAWEAGTKYIITNDSRTTVGYDVGPVYSANEFAVEVRRAGYLLLQSSLDVSGPISGITALTSDQNYNSAVSTSGINVSYNSGITTVTPVSGTYTLDQIYKAIIDFHFTTANTESSTVLPVTQNTLELTFGSALILNLNSTHNITAGSKLKSLSTTQNISFNGSGQANVNFIYETSLGKSTTFTFKSIQTGTSLVVFDAAGVTKYYQSEVSTAGDYNYYIPPGVTGTYYYATEKYGKQRESGSFAANTGGAISFTPSYVEDVGISQATKSTVAAYTAIDTLDKFYDYTAYSRLSESFIKLGQIATRSGTAVDIGTYSLKVNSAAASVESIASLLITIKAPTLASGSKYQTILAAPPATVTANTVETITCAIEDANGDSQVTIQGGSGNFTLWKISNATSEDDYATGINLGNVGNITYRFLSATGFKIVIRDNTTGFRQVCPMDKGIYTRGLFFGDQVQLAQSAEVSEINDKVDLLKNVTDQILADALTAIEVREEMDTNSLKLDVAVSTRLAAIDFVEAPSVEEIRTEMDSNSTKLSNLDVTVSSRLADADYVEPNNTAIDALPTLSEIEASTILAKEATLSGVATSSQLDTLEDNIIAALPSSAPSASTIASAVRTELETELDRIDVAVSTRSAVDADNTSIAAIKNKTDNLPASPVSVTDLQPIKKNTDLIPATV